MQTQNLKSCRHHLTSQEQVVHLYINSIAPLNHTFNVTVIKREPANTNRWFVLFHLIKPPLRLNSARAMLELFEAFELNHNYQSKWVKFFASVDTNQNPTHFGRRVNGPNKACTNCVTVSLFDLWTVSHVSAQTNKQSTWSSSTCRH